MNKQEIKLKNWIILTGLKLHSPISEFNRNSRHVCNQNRKKYLYLYWHCIFCSEFASNFSLNHCIKWIQGQKDIKKQKAVRFEPELIKNKFDIYPKEFS